MWKGIELKTTKKQFEIFKDEFTRLQDLFGLNDWGIYFYHMKLNNAYANITANLGGMCATVRFNTDCDKSCWEHLDVKETARHECFHLLNAKIIGLAKKRFINSDELYREDEAIVNILECFDFNGE